MTATELRTYLIQLETERHLALISGLAEIESYMAADLDEELEICRNTRSRLSLRSTTLRVELSGPLLG